MSKNKSKGIFKGKQILMLGLVALVITAGYYRWTTETDKLAMPVTGESIPVNTENSQDKEEGQSENQSVDSEMEKSRRDRDSSRDKAMEEWKKMGESSEASPEAKLDAQERVKKANENSEKEGIIETQVKAKGYEDCFAHITDSGVSVMVKGGEIDGAKVAQIKDIILSQTDVAVKDIKISAQ